MTRLLGWGGLAALLLAGAGPAWAHHSVAIFDRSREVTLKGVVTAFEWTNPHALIQVRAPGRYGEHHDFEVECASPTVLSRAGWSRTSLKRGDQVVMRLHPLKSGDPGGRLEQLTLPDGRILVDRN